MAKRTDTGSEILTDLYHKTGTLISDLVKNLSTVPKITQAINATLKNMGSSATVSESMVRHWMVKNGFIAPFQKLAKEPPKAPSATFESLVKQFPQYEWHWFTAQFPRGLDSGEFLFWCRLGDHPDQKAINIISKCHPDTVVASRVKHKNGNSGIAVGIPKQLDLRLQESLLTLD